MILVDTSGLLAALDASAADHRACAGALLGDDRRVLSPFVLAELDYLIRTRIGGSARLTLLAEVALGAYELAEFSKTDVSAARTVMAGFPSLDVSLADASIAVLSRRLNCPTVLTLDQRHFRILTGAGERHLRLLPADL